MHEHSIEHLATTKHVLRYLKGTLRQGILLSSTDEPKLTGFYAQIGAIVVIQGNPPQGFAFC